MNDLEKSKAQLIGELEQLRRQVRDLESREGHAARARDPRQADQEELRYRAQLLDLVPQAVLAIDADGRVLYGNKAAQRMFLQGPGAEPARGAPERSLAKAMHGHPDVLLTPRDLNESWEEERLIERQDGTRFPAVVSNTSISDDAGRRLGAVRVLHRHHSPQEDGRGAARIGRETAPHL